MHVFNATGMQPFPVDVAHVCRPGECESNYGAFVNILIAFCVLL